MDEEFCRMANFYPTLDFLVDYTVTNNGPNQNCPGSYTLVANVQTPGPGEPGQPNYSFVWELGTNPFFDPDNPPIIISTDNFVTVEDPQAFRPNRYVKLTVISEDGYQLSRVKRLRFCQHTEKSGDIGSSFRKTDDLKTEFSIAPNPAENASSIVLSNLPRETQSIDIVNTLGHLVWRKDLYGQGRKALPNTQFEFNPILKQGLYLVQLKNANGKQIVSKQLIIL